MNSRLIFTDSLTFTTPVEDTLFIYRFSYQSFCCLLRPEPFRLYSRAVKDHRRHQGIPLFRIDDLFPRGERRRGPQGPPLRCQRRGIFGNRGPDRRGLHRNRERPLHGPGADVARRATCARTVLDEGEVGNDDHGRRRTRHVRSKTFAVSARCCGFRRCKHELRSAPIGEARVPRRALTGAGRVERDWEVPS